MFVKRPAKSHLKTTYRRVEDAWALMSFVAPRHVR
jgi:hypothetical protein